MRGMAISQPEAVKSDVEIIHVRVGNEDSAPVDDDELSNIRDIIKEGLEDKGMGDDYQVFITGHDMEMRELPALDDYADKLADRVAERLE